MERVWTLEERWERQWARPILLFAMCLCVALGSGCADKKGSEGEEISQACPPTCDADILPSDPLELVAQYDGDDFFVEILDIDYLPERDIAYMCTNVKGLLGVDLSDPSVIKLPWAMGSFDVPPEITLSSLANSACQHIAVMEGQGGESDVVVVTNHGNEFAPNGYIALLTAPPVTGEERWEELFPVRAVHSASGFRYEGFVIRDGYLYAAARAHGLEIFEITPDSLSLVGSVSNFYDAMDVTLNGHFAFVADAGGAVAAIDVSDPANPEMVSYFPLNGVIRDAEMLGENTLVLGAGATGLYALDVTQASAPVLLSHLDTHGTALQIAVDGTNVHVANWEDFVVVDMSNPTAPILVGEETGPTSKVWPRYLAIAAHDNVVLAGEWGAVYRYIFHPGAVSPEIRAEVWELNFGNVTLASATRALVLYNDGFLPLEVTVDSLPPGVSSVVPETLTISPLGVEVLEVTVEVSEAEIRETLTFSTNDVDEESFGVYVLANLGSPGVGDPFPAVNFRDSETGDPVEGSALFDGKVTLLSYFSSF